MSKVDGGKPMFTMLHNAPCIKTALIHAPEGFDAGRYSAVSTCVGGRTERDTLMLMGRPKRLPAVFYRSDLGREPVRESSHGRLECR